DQRYELVGERDRFTLLRAEPRLGGDRWCDIERDALQELGHEAPRHERREDNVAKEDLPQRLRLPGGKNQRSEHWKAVAVKQRIELDRDHSASGILGRGERCLERRHDSDQVTVLFDALDDVGETEPGNT